MKKPSIDRRSFLASSAAASSMLFLPNITVAKSHNTKVTRKAPSEKLNMAVIGIGGRGKNVMESLAATEQVNIVAICDIDIGSNWTAEMRLFYRCTCCREPMLCRLPMKSSGSWENYPAVFHRDWNGRFFMMPPILSGDLFGKSL